MQLGLNNSEIQKANRHLVLRIMLESKSITRAELAQRTGLRKATITNIINELSELGLIEENGISQPEFGRPGELLRLVIKNIYIISIAINRKNYRIDLYDLHGRLEQTLETPIARARDIKLTVDELVSKVSGIVAARGEKSVLGIGLAMPGPYIRRSEGLELALVTEFEALSQVNVREALEAAVDVPVFAEHDAKLSAFAEFKNISRYCQIPNPSLIALGSVGFGIGAGIIINGKIVEGAIGIAGEIGHMGINFNGPRLELGSAGSYEQYAGTDSAVKYMLLRLNEFPDTMLTEASGYKEIVQAYLAGDALAVWVMEKLAVMLGYGITNLIYILNPDIIIICAEYPDCPQFAEKVRQTVKSCVHPTIYDSVSIQPSGLGRDSIIRGGYYIVLEKFLKSQQLIDSIRSAATQDGV